MASDLVRLLSTLTPQSRQELTHGSRRLMSLGLGQIYRASSASIALVVHLAILQPLAVVAKALSVAPQARGPLLLAEAKADIDSPMEEIQIDRSSELAAGEAPGLPESAQNISDLAPPAKLLAWASEGSAADVLSMPRVQLDGVELTGEAIGAEAIESKVVEPTVTGADEANPIVAAVPTLTTAAESIEAEPFHPPSSQSSSSHVALGSRVSEQVLPGSAVLTPPPSQDEVASKGEKPSSPTLLSVAPAITNPEEVRSRLAPADVRSPLATPAQPAPLQVISPPPPALSSVSLPTERAVVAQAYPQPGYGQVYPQAYPQPPVYPQAYPQPPVYPQPGYVQAYPQPVYYVAYPQPYPVQSPYPVAPQPYPPAYPQPGYPQAYAPQPYPQYPQPYQVQPYAHPGYASQPSYAAPNYAAQPYGASSSYAPYPGVAVAQPAQLPPAPLPGSAAPLSIPALPSSNSYAGNGYAGNSSYASSSGYSGNTSASGFSAPLTPPSIGGQAALPPPPSLSVGDTAFSLPGPTGLSNATSASVPNEAYAAIDLDRVPDLPPAPTVPEASEQLPSGIGGPLEFEAPTLELPPLPLQPRTEVNLPVGEPAPTLRSTALARPTSKLQAVFLSQGGDSAARGRISGTYPMTPNLLFGGSLDVASGDAFTDDTNGFSVNEAFVAGSLSQLPNLRLVAGQMDLTSYFDRNSFAKDSATHYFNPVFQTNPALSAVGMGSRTGVLMNWSATDNLDLKASAYSSAEDVGDFSLNAFAGEVGFRTGNAIVRATYASGRDSGQGDGFREIFELERNGERGVQKGDREEAYGVNAEVFIPSLNAGVFGRYGRYENRTLGEGGDTYSLGLSFLDVFRDEDRLGIAYGRDLSNDKLRQRFDGESPNVMELFYDFRFLPNLRMGFTLQERNSFSELAAGFRLKAEFDALPAGNLDEVR